MAREWKPGDVARVNGAAAVRADHVWHTQAGILSDYNVVHARRLVVIDPEDAATLDALGKAWDEAESCDLDNEQPMTMRALRMRVALRSLVADPKPEEPTGLGAVVEDVRGDHWVRVETGAWRRDGFTFRTFDKIYDLGPVRVLSEGWSE